MSVNKAIIVGFVGKQPETRAFQNGSSVTNFSVATSERFKDQSGEYRESTEWHKISCFGKLSEIATKYVNKGSQVYIEGKITTRKYEVGGVEKYSTEIRADVLQLLGSKEASKELPLDRASITNNASLSLGDMDENVPF